MPRSIARQNQRDAQDTNGLWGRICSRCYCGAVDAAADLRRAAYSADGYVYAWSQLRGGGDGRNPDLFSGFCVSDHISEQLSKILQINEVCVGRFLRPNGRANADSKGDPQNLRHLSFTPDSLLLCYNHCIGLVNGKARGQLASI
jgi:hypothetical protein